MVYGWDDRFVATFVQCITHLAIAWLVAAVLLATPVVVIAACGPASATAASSVVERPDADWGHDVRHDQPSDPCDQVRPVSLDGALTPIQRLPDNATIELVGRADRHTTLALPDPVVARFPGLSPPPESPPPQVSAIG